MKKILLVWLSVSLSAYFVQAQPALQTSIAGVHLKHHKHAKSAQGKKHAKKALKKLTGSDASVQSKATFATQFGNVQNVQWERQDFFDVATFMQNGQQMKAFFDNDGEFVGTSMHTNMKAVPANGQAEIAKMYPGYVVSDVILYDDNEEQISDIILYGTQFESTDNYFVELNKDNRKLIVKVSPEGHVSLFKEIRG